MWDRHRRRLGDDTFERLVRAWPQARMHGHAELADLVSWWSAQSGQDLAPFFDTWLDSSDSPA